MIHKLLQANKIFLIIFCFSLLTFLAHTFFTKTAIFADGKFYYATTRSLVKDFDIKFNNDFPPLGITPTKTGTGYVWNKYPPGASLSWTPLFFVADGLVTLLNFTPGVQLDASGFGIIYQSAVGISTIFLGSFGLYLVYQLLKDYFSREISLLTTIALFGTTNIIFYLAVEPINSHGVSFFASSLFVFYFLKYKDRKYYYLTLGFLGGIAGLVRTQDAAILTLPVLELLFVKKDYLKSKILNLKHLTLGAIIAFLPQIIMWKLIFNTYWYSPYAKEGFFFLSPKIVHVLFNTQNGLFVLTPVIGVSLVGIYLFQKENKKVAYYALAYFLLQLYLISSWSAYNQIGSFSIRMIISTYPLLAFGLAQIVKLTKERFGLLKTFSLITIFSLINSFLIIRYLLLY